MARRGKVRVRKSIPDPVYKSRVLAKVINRSMRDGKKSVAQKEVYKALEIIKDKLKDDPIKVFTKSLENIKPNMEVRPRRIGGAAYQVPQPVRGPRKESLAIRWMINAANLKPNSQFKTYAAKLSAEILEAFKGEGGAIAKKKEMERSAEANKAFSHFRW